MKQREIKQYILKITATPDIQEYYREMLNEYYNRLNHIKNNHVDMEHYVKGTKEPVMDKFVIHKSQSGEYYER